MDVSKLPILIVNPAAQAEKNLKEHLDTRMPLAIYWADRPDFFALDPEKGLGRLLVTIKKWPNATWNHVYNISGLTRQMHAGDFYNLSCYAEYAKLITDKPPKTYKGSKPGLRLTKLGYLLLKQSGIEV